jgi:hypothetical protein
LSATQKEKKELLEKTRIRKAQDENGRDKYQKRGIDNGSE